MSEQGTGDRSNFALPAIITLVVAALMVAGYLVLKPRWQADAASNCIGNACHSEFQVAGENGQLPTVAQFTKRMPVNDRLAMTWHHREAGGYQSVTMPVTSEYFDLMIFAACTGGGKFTVTVVDAEDRRSWMSVGCDGVMGTGLGLNAVVLGESEATTPSPLGPYTFELSTQGQVTDAEFFVQGRFSLGLPLPSAD